MSRPLSTGATLLALTLILLAGGCDVSDGQRCADLDDIIRARALQLPQICEADLDCVLVEVRPGYTVAANSTPTDPELDDTIRRRIELCGDFEPDGIAYRAVCEERRCLARKMGQVDLPDAGGDDDAGDDDGGGDDVGGCECSVDEDCRFGAVCDASCECDPVCRDACLNLERCGQLDGSVGLGVDLDNCVDLCISQTGGEGSIPPCLRDAACDNTLSCL